jgi:hypothetical protein
MHKSTAMARFLRVPAGSNASLGNGNAKTAVEQAADSAAFFRDLGPAVGVSDPASMRLQSRRPTSSGRRTSPTVSTTATYRSSARR